MVYQYGEVAGKICGTYCTGMKVMNGSATGGMVKESGYMGV